MVQKVQVEEFKKLIKDMYRGFPNWQYREMVEKVIVTQKMRTSLIEAKILEKERYIDGGQEIEVYMLGPNALTLISAWETEDLTKSIRSLTIILLILTILSALLSLC